MKRAVGIVLLALGAACVAYGFAVTRREASYRRFVEQGDTALARDDSYSAIEAFSVAISLKDDSMAAHLKRGEAYRRRGEFDAAVRDLRRAAAIDPLAIHPRELLGDVHYAVATADGSSAVARFGRALERYRESVALDDRSARLQYKVGLAAYRAGRLAEAIPALREAIRLDPRFAEAHYVLGMCLRDVNQPDAAVRSLERSVALAPALLAAREEIAEMDTARRRHEAPLVQLEALVALQPGAARERALALGYARAGNLDRAVAQLARTARRYPDDSETFVVLGRLWLERAGHGGRVELGKALAALGRGVSNDSSSAAMTLLGRALLRAGDAGRAEQMLQQAAVRFPVEPEAFLHLAEAAQRQGHAAVAQQALLDYAVLSPPSSLDAPLLARLAEVHSARGNLDAAHRAVDAALEKDPTNAAALAVKRRLQ